MYGVFLRIDLKIVAWASHPNVYAAFGYYELF